MNKNVLYFQIYKKKSDLLRSKREVTDNKYDVVKVTNEDDYVKRGGFWKQDRKDRRNKREVNFHVTVFRERSIRTTITD